MTKMYVSPFPLKIKGGQQIGAPPNLRECGWGHCLLGGAEREGNLKSRMREAHNSRTNHRARRCVTDFAVVDGSECHNPEGSITS